MQKASPCKSASGKMLTILKAKYFYADNSKLIPQDPKGMPYRNPISFGQVMGF